MSAPALALSFFDSGHEIYGTARAGASMLFEGREPRALAGGPAIEQSGSGWRAQLEGELALELEPVSEPADLGGVAVRVCRVRGEAGGRPVEGLGTLSETRQAPRWEDLDALRTISVLVDEGHALLALARRPRGALGHGDERVTAKLIDDGSLLDVREARISTVYDGEARQRSAGLELWLEGEEFPRRASGVVIAGSSLQLDDVDVHAAVFHWRMRGREGVGGYEVMARAQPPVAA